MSLTRLVTVLDCKDPKALAPFWGGVLGYKQVAAAGQYVVLGTGDRTQHELILQGVAEPKTGKNRMHLDVKTMDVEAEVDRLVGLGATRVGEVEEWGERWVVMTYPEGNELCVCAEHC